MTHYKSKYRSLVCPCCKIGRYQGEYLHLEEFNNQYRFDYMLSVIESAKQNFLHWACDKCLEEKKAILGKPELQNWGGFAYPYFAFYDEEKKCETCGKAFTFGKEEQKFWFEKLKFNVWSDANDCAECRKSQRKASVRNTKISELIKSLDPKNSAQVTELIDLYLEINKIEKAKYYLALLQKNIPDKNTKEVITQIKKIKEKIVSHNIRFKQ